MISRQWSICSDFRSQLISSPSKLRSRYLGFVGMASQDSRPLMRSKCTVIVQGKQLCQLAKRLELSASVKLSLLSPVHVRSMVRATQPLRVESLIGHFQVATESSKCVHFHFVLRFSVFVAARNVCVLPHSYQGLKMEK